MTFRTAKLRRPALLLASIAWLLLWAQVPFTALHVLSDHHLQSEAQDDKEHRDGDNVVAVLFTEHHAHGDDHRHLTLQAAVPRPRPPSLSIDPLLAPLAESVCASPWALTHCGHRNCSDVAARLPSSQHLSRSRVLLI